MRRVAIESPYAGNVERNMAYLRACMADCIARGEAPFASHALYTQPGVLDDDDQAERALGIKAGFAWSRVADARVFYMDLGMSSEMRMGLADANARGQFVEVRHVARWLDDDTRAEHVDAPASSLATRRAR